MPLFAAGSLGHAFAPARPVGLAVRPACALALATALSKRGEPTFELLRYPLGGNRPSQTDRLARSRRRKRRAVRRPDAQGWYFTGGSAPAGAGASMPPTYATHGRPAANARQQ